MSTYILIHGAWHGGWCWHKVTPLLEAHGHRVLTPDLPGLGNDPTPVTQISMSAYRDSICALLDAQDEPSIVIGHSMAGAVLNLVGDTSPDKVTTLVYLTAMLLENGESIFDAVTHDPQSLVLDNLLPSEDGSWSDVKSEALRDVFYANCSDADIIYARARLKPQALSVLAEPIHVNDVNWGRIPRIYIECLQDRAITAAQQKRMYTNLPCREVLTLDTDHSPFFSTPELLAKQLLRITP